MENSIHKSWLSVLLIPIALFIIMIPYSSILGWNFFTAIIFWFMVIPVLSIYLPIKFLKDHDLLFIPIIGMTLFYGIIVFMIYDHYKTDYFLIMEISYGVNIILMTLVLLIKRYKAQIK